MYVLRLFHRDRPSEQVDARLLAAGELKIGRDPAADWPLDDPDGVLSRIHCTLLARDGELLLFDSSTNGTFVDGGTRVTKDAPFPLQPGQTVQIGTMRLLVDTPPDGGVDFSATVHLPRAIPAAGWDEPAPERPLHPDASLLEAFCEGAKLDASAFSDEDPVALMRRLGGIYQQTVLGLVALTAQRTQMKEKCEIDRTTVRAAANNPIKWTAPRRLAEILLRERDGEFLTGDEAVRASFLDISAHVSAIAAGANGAIGEMLSAFDPDALAAAAAQGGFSLRGKAAAQVAVHAERHLALRSGGVAAAFRDAYQTSGTGEDG
jgi:predicted component of type VI protein secretion system